MGVPDKIVWAAFLLATLFPIGAMILVLYLLISIGLGVK